MQVELNPAPLQMAVGLACFLEVLLVVFLGPPEGGGRGDFGDDGALPQRLSLDQ